MRTKCTDIDMQISVRPWRRKAVPSEILGKILYIPDCKISFAFLSYIFTHCWFDPLLGSGPSFLLAVPCLKNWISEMSNLCLKQGQGLERLGGTALSGLRLSAFRALSVQQFRFLMKNVKYKDVDVRAAFCSFNFFSCNYFVLIVLCCIFYPVGPF